jgi:hypothetical protein
LRKALAGGALIAAFAVASFTLAPAASASSGGGCFYPSYGSFAAVSACISASNETLLPDGYVTWNTNPPLCSVLLQLVDIAGNVVASNSYPCGWRHYGPLGFQGNNGTNYYSTLTVYSGFGKVESVSPDIYLGY